MSGVEGVAAIPGGALFMDLWDQVDGDPGEISAVVRTWKSDAAKVNESSGAVRSATRHLDGVWAGTASDSFAAYMGKFHSASDKMEHHLTNAAGVLMDAAHAVTTAKTQLTQIAARILSQYEKAKKEHPIVAPLLGLVYVLEGVEQAQPHVTTMTTALQNATSKLQSGAKTSSFLAMNVTSGAHYLPKKGHTISWEPVVSSTGGGGGKKNTGGSTPGSGNTGGNSGNAPKTPVSGDVKSWIEQARKILEQHGIPASKMPADDIAMMIQHESSGNPHAQNNWDSNAAAGHPSKGIMQCIDSTFNAHALSGHHNIWNPVDNIIAGVRYAIGRYGSLDNVPGVAAVHHGGSYVGY